MPAPIRAATVALLWLAGGVAAAQASHPLRVKIDSQPQQAAIYIDSKEAGIKGYTPAELHLARGSYKVILELPGFRTLEKSITVTRAEGFLFTLERPARAAVLEVRASTGNDAATGAQLFVDGAAVGTVPARVEVQAGKHALRVTKPGFADYTESAELVDGAERQLVIDLQPLAKKGGLLVTSDLPGAEVVVDGVKRDTTPALVTDLAEGPHTVEVRRDTLSWKQVITIAGGQQLKVTAQLTPAAAPSGTLRVVCGVAGAEVWIDGARAGSVNSAIANLPVGQHIVEVRAPGYNAQSLDVTIAAGEQRVARADLVAQPVAPVTARLRVVTPVSNAEVFVDGAAAGHAPFDRADLAPGKHFVSVRAHGFAEWKREVDLDPAQPTTLTVELSAAGTVKILANVAGAAVSFDGQPVGRTPLTLDNVSAGDHFVEVKQEGYADAKQTVHLEGGEQKVLSAELAPLRHPREEAARRVRGMSSFSAQTLDPARFTADLAGGFVPFGQLRLTVGVYRWKWVGVDAGVELRTIGYFTEGGAHARLQFVQAGPIAIGFDTFIGGGGGPTHRNDFIFEAGIPLSLLLGDIVRFTAHPYLQVYSDKNCPSAHDLRADADADAKAVDQTGTYHAEQGACEAYDGMAGANGSDLPTHVGTALPKVTQDPRTRFVGARMMLQAVLELAVTENVSVFAIFEGDPVGQRQALTAKFSSDFPGQDPQLYGRVGLTFKF